MAGPRGPLTSVLAMERPYGMLWFWIGTHDAYERMLR